MWSEDNYVDDYDNHDNDIVLQSTKKETSAKASICFSQWIPTS